MIFILARHAKVKPLNAVLENWYSNMIYASIYILSNLLSLFHSYFTCWLSRTRCTILSTTGSTEQFVYIIDQLVNIFLLHLTFLNSLQSKLHVQPLMSLGGTSISIFVPLNSTVLPLCVSVDESSGKTSLQNTFHRSGTCALQHKSHRVMCSYPSKFQQPVLYYYILV
jgi:sensor histidine kinase YesM